MGEHIIIRNINNISVFILNEENFYSILSGDMDFKTESRIFLCYQESECKKMVDK